MSLGLGHRYWVHRIHGQYGTLEECIKYMQDNPPANKFQWYELRPQVEVNKKNGSWCTQYEAALVEEA